VGDCSEVYVLDRQAIVRAVAFSPNGEFLATGGYDNTVFVWNVSSRELIASLSNGYDSVNIIVFSADSTSVLFDSGYGARLWNFVDTYEVNFTGSHTWYVSSVGFNPSDPRQVVTASHDQTVRVWDAAAGKQLFVVRGQDGVIYSAAFDPDGKHLATGSADQTVRIWDIGEWQKRVLFGHTNQVLSAVFSSDSRRIATTGSDGTIRIWDAQSGRQLKSLQYISWTAPSGVVFSPDDRQLLTSSDDGTWRLWNAETGEPEYGSTLITHYIHDAQFNPDGTRILTVNRDTFGYIWDAKTRELLVRLEGHAGWVASGMFSPDGKLVVTASSDKTARLWDAQTGKEVRAFLGHSDLVVDADFSSDGKRIVTASVDGTARIWDTDSGQVLHILKGHRAEVTNAKFSPDDKYVATSSRDDTVRLWDADTGSELVQLLGHTHDVVAVNFSPDGRYVVSASLDGTARIHFVYFEDILALGRSLLSERAWTCVERVKYLHERVVCPTPTIAATSISPATVNSNEVSQAQNTIIADITTAAYSGDWVKTLSLIEYAEANNLPLDPILSDSEFLNDLCWRGSIDGFAAEFLEYCERAVELAPDDAAIRDSRGLARALTGDYSGAIEDFQYFVDHYDDEILIEQREQWIIDLKAGMNPITPEVLEELKDQ
jgi:WD40 repeat protein